MTLIQAQHVIAGDRRGAGVNVFTYAVGGVIDYGRPASEVIDAATRAPTRLLVAVREVDAPSAAVISYLDVTAHDGLKRVEIASAIQRALAKWPGTTGDWRTDAVALRFVAAEGIDGPHVAIELRRLWSAIARAIGAPSSAPRAASVSGGTPVVITRSRTPDGLGLRYEISPGALRALRLALPPEHAVARSAYVTIDTYDSFEYFAPTKIEAELATSMTGLSAEQMDALCGGAAVYDENGEILWVSPALAAGS